MKKKILSAILAVALLFACMAPAVFAADADTHDHDHDTVLMADTADTSTLKNAYNNAFMSLFNHITSNGDTITRSETSYELLEAFYSAKEALVAAGGTTSEYYDTFCDDQKASLETLSADYISQYKSFYNSAKSNASNSTYEAYYNLAKGAYNELLPSEQESLDSAYAFSNLQVPGSGDSGDDDDNNGNNTPTITTENLKAIQNATTLVALSSAVTEAMTNLTQFTTREQIYIEYARDVVTFLTNVSNATATVTSTSLGTNGTLYSTYLNFNTDQIVLCNNIQDVDTDGFIKAHRIAADFLSLEDPSSDPAIVEIISRYNAIGNPGAYFKADFQTAISNAYSSYLTQYNIKASGSFNTSTNQANIAITLSAGFNITTATINLDIENTFFTSSWFNSAVVTNGTIISSDYSSGVLSVLISGINNTQTTLQLVLNIPSSYVGNNINFNVSGVVGNSTGTEDFSTDFSLACCSHKVAGALVYELHTIKKATCSSGGLSGYFCKLCGARLLSSDGAPADEISLLPTSHTPGDKVTAGVNNIKATCTTNGVQYYECADCYSVISKGITLPASHKLDITTITWNETANAWYATCSECNVEYNVSATKTKCTCEETYGKDYSKVISSKTATCGVRGYKAYQCQLCGVSWVETNGTALESHTWGAWVTTTPSTCTTMGVQTRTCSVCQKTETQNISTISHNFDISSYKIITPSTCTTKGTATKTCSYCNLVETFSIDLKEHTYDNGVVTKEATCSETGIKTYTCTADGCTHTKTETIAINPDNHDLTTTVEKEATCIENGLQIITCKNCDHKVETVLEAKGHTWRVDEETDKVTKKTCVVCKTVWEQKKTSKATTLNITANKLFTLNITDTATAEKDVIFSVNNVELAEETVEWFDDFFDEGKYDAEYQGAYTANLVVDSKDAAFDSNMNLAIDLGDDYKKNEIFVVYITDAGTPSAKIEAERDGSSIIISGKDFDDFADKTFIVMTSNEKVGGSPLVAIIICIAVVAIAGIVVVLVLKSSKGNKKNKGVRV